MVEGLTADDLVLCLVSGGASRAAGDAGAGPDARRQAGRQPGAAEIRRQHHGDELRAQSTCPPSRAGALRAAASGAGRDVLISDVPGDDPSVIGIRPDGRPIHDDLADALAVLHKYSIDDARGGSRAAAHGRRTTPKPSDPRLAARRSHHASRATQDALEAAADGSPRQAEGTDARSSSATASRARRATWPWSMPASPRQVARATASRCQRRPCYLSGGETTVTVRGQGRGGRNAEFLLAAGGRARRRAGHSMRVAGDTDGIDGTEDNAGATADPTSLARALRPRASTPEGNAGRQ